MPILKRPAIRIQPKKSLIQRATEKGNVVIEKGKFGTIIHTGIKKKK